MYRKGSFRCTWPIVLPLMLMLAANSSADEGKPIAIRWWGQAMVSIETYWNLRVVVDPFPPSIGYEDPQLAADLVLITHEHPDHHYDRLVRGDPVIVHGLEDVRRVRAVSHVLDRLPNAEQATWRASAAAGQKSGHEVNVTSVSSWHDDEQGGARGANAIFVIEVDGVRIVHCGNLGQAKLTPEQLDAFGRVDVLLVPVGGIFTIDGPQAVEIIRQVRPRYAIPLRFKTPALTIGLHSIDPFIEAVGNQWELERSKSNTLAVRNAQADADEATRIAVLNYQPWKPQGELAELLARMRQACRDSRAVFEPLSVSQMNFRPGNGTHTPRWNAEHMMGRELLFFTQIYTAREPAILPIDLNPAQMPPDYKPAHADWTGAEEARQMERADALVQRFAYLLDGVGLDERAPGSRWTLRGLLRQMERHYGEHTANVKKKFELPDWPKE
jgi:L-ascorbate metabolism protein UlaG (beta-lactamase superfamily)